MTLVDRRFGLSLHRRGRSIAHKLGIRTRHLCRNMAIRLESPRKGHRNPELAAAALRGALIEAGLVPRDLSYLIGHTATPARLLPPNIGQGGGCAMMNALSLAVYLDREADVSAALATWERNERPVTEHAQRISYLLGLPTTWPPALRAMALGMAGRSKWLVRQRTRTALHRPTGTTP